MRNVFYGGGARSAFPDQHQDGLSKKPFGHTVDTGITGSPTTDGGSFSHSRYLKEAEHEDSTVQIQIPQ